MRLCTVMCIVTPLIAGTPLELDVPKCNNHQDWAISSEAYSQERSTTIESTSLRWKRVEYTQAGGNGEHLKEMKIQSNLCGNAQQFIRERYEDQRTRANINDIGDAVDVPEGTAIPLDKLGSTSKQVEVKKAGKGVEITDEAVLSGYGDPLGEAAKQLQLAIANKVDEDIIAALKGATQTADGDIKTVAGLQAAIDMFDDEDDEPLTLLVSPADASALRTDANTNFLSATEIGANRVVNGSIGEILGVQIVRSRKLEAGEAFLVKSGALKLVMKRGTQVESERNIVNKTTVVTADQHYAPYLYNDAKVVKFEAAPGV